MISKEINPTKFQIIKNNNFFSYLLIPDMTVIMFKIFNFGISEFQIYLINS